MNGKPGVRDAILACEIPNSQGLLNDTGRLLIYNLHKARQCRATGMRECASDYQAEAERIAREVLEQQAAYRKRLTPLIRRHA